MTSLRSRILHTTLRHITGALALNLPIHEQRRRMDELARLGIRLPRGVAVRAIQIGEIPAEWIEPTGIQPERTILYLHGGGYCLCSLDTHRGLTARLAQASQARVLNIAYRLAPEYPFPAALEDSLAAYRWLIGQGIPPEQISIGGDSAGGGLTLSTAVSLRDAGEPLPASLFLISPWTDLTFSGESFRSKTDSDPIFGGSRPHYVSPYIGTYDPTHPLISPLFADLHGLPPVLVHVGNDEMLLDDSSRLVEKFKASGVETRIQVWEGMWHVFQVFAPYVPEAQQSIDIIGEFIRQGKF